MELIKELTHRLSAIPENPAYLLRRDILEILVPVGAFFLSARLFLRYSHLRSLRTDRR